MNPGIGVLVHLSPQQATNVLVFLNRVQLAGNEARELAVLQQIIEQAIQSYQEMQMKMNGGDPVPVEEGT